VQSVIGVVIVPIRKEKESTKFEHMRLCIWDSWWGFVKLGREQGNGWRSQRFMVFV